MRVISQRAEKRFKTLANSLAEICENLTNKARSLKRTYISIPVELNLGALPYAIPPFCN